MRISVFENDYLSLSNLIQTSWPSEHKSFPYFSVEYLKYLIESPATERDLTLAAYHRDQLICFTLSIQKEIIVKDKTYRGLLTTLATSDPQFAHLFPYLKLKNIWAQTAICKNYEFNFGYMAWGIKNNEIEKFTTQRLGFNLSHVNQFSSYSGIASEIFDNVANSHSSGTRIQIRAFQKQDAPECIALIDRLTHPGILCQKWQENAFVQRLEHERFCRSKVILRNGVIEGFISCRIVSMVHGTKIVPTCFFYDLFIDQLSETERIHAFSVFMTDLEKSNVQYINIPNMGYFQTDYLKEIGFRPLRFKESKTNLYIAFFKENIRFGTQEPFYLEII